MDHDEPAQPGTSSGRGLARLVNAYRSLAVFFLNLLLFLIVLSLVLGVIRGSRNRDARESILADATIERMLPLYPGWSADDVRQLWGETWLWRTGLGYAPFLQIRERPYAGRHLNVVDAGYRVGRDQGPWPPDPKNFNVFLFGGSTTFSYGLPDDRTLGSYLQSSLARSGIARTPKVYNFGCGYYFSLVERVLFEKLLLEGHRPDLALFVDGLNDFV